MRMDKKKVATILLMLNLAFIWGNSLMNGTDSGNLSGGIMDWLNAFLGLEPEGAELLHRLINIRHALMVGRKTLWEFTLILLGDDKRMVRGECKYRSEEWLCALLQLLSHIADELLIPNAPIAIEIILSVYLLIVLTAIQMLHTRSAGKSTKAHRAVIGATEEHCAVALILQYCRQGTGLRHRLWHQHKWVLIGWNRRPHRRQRLNGTAAIGIHIIECIALTHQRIKKWRITLLRLILI